MTEEDKKAGTPAEEQKALEAQADALRKAKGKGIKQDSDDDDEDDDEVEFGNSDDDDDDSASSSDDESDDAADSDAEDDLKAVEADAPGPSTGKKRKKAADDEEEKPEILEGLSGDEVDPGLIVAGGRGSRRGRGADSGRPKYTKQAAVGSDEDDW